MRFPLAILSDALGEAFSASVGEASEKAWRFLSRAERLRDCHARFERYHHLRMKLHVGSTSKSTSLIISQQRAQCKYNNSYIETLMLFTTKQYFKCYSNNETCYFDKDGTLLHSTIINHFFEHHSN